MTGRLQGKVAIVTGAGQGIGGAVAELFSQQGAAVTLVTAHADSLATTAAALRDRAAPHLAFTADVSSATEAEGIVRRTVEEFGGVDILVNNAGIMPGGTVLTHTEEEWDRVFAVNVKSI